MQFDYEITSDEFVACQLLAYKMRRGRKLIQNGGSWILIGLMLIGIAWDKRAGHSDSMLLAIIGACSIYVGFVYFFPASRLRRAYQKTELSGKRFRAELNQDGFEVTGELRSWRVRWEGVQLKGENELVFILNSAGTLFMFGRKYLNNEQQVEFRRLSRLATEVRPIPNKSSTQ